MKKNTLLSILFVFGFVSTIYGQSAKELIQSIDDNRTFAQSTFDGSMQIKDKFGQRTVTFLAYGEGKENTLLNFTSKEEKGQKILRNSKEIYLYFPESEKVLRIQGAAMRDSMVGSDVSYDDLARLKSTGELYEATFIGEEVLPLGKTKKVLLISKDDTLTSYHKEIWWVDVSRKVVLKSEYYSLSDKILKTMEAKKVEFMNSRYIVTSMLYQNLLKKNTWTQVNFNKLDFTTPLSKKIFSLENLSF